MADDRINTAPGVETAPRRAPQEWGVTPTEAGDMLNRQMCPICGEGPWKSPLNHVAKRHGIDRYTMRDVCGLTSTSVVAAPELSEHLSELHAGRDMSEVTAASVRGRRKYRMTQAGKQNLTANLASVTVEQRMAALEKAHTPEARTKQGATLKAAWAAKPPEAREEVRKRLARAPEECSQQAREMWARRGVQPCGTVASYKRGCRCEQCREAKRASRR